MVLSAFVIIFSSIDSATIEVLKEIRPLYLAAILCLVVSMWFFDSLKFIFLAKAVGEELPFKKVLPVVWINYFGSAITPMQSGGGPFQMYLLYRYGVAVGKSIAITLVRTVQIILFLALALPFYFIITPSFMSKNVWVRGFIGYVILFIGCATALIVISILRPGWIKNFTSGVLIKMRRVKFLNPRLLIKFARRVNKEIDAYNANIKLMISSGKRWFFLSIAATAGYLAVYLSVMPCLIMAAGFEINYLECILAEALLLFLLYFVPTPGASGAAEGGAAAVIALFVPWNLAGVLAIVWRVMTEYTGTLMGTYTVVKMLGWSGADRVMSDPDGEAMLSNEGR